MACRKCGSDWKTLRGRDCSRCPHCDKVQRCVERKRGRWQDQETQMPCKHCGVVFAATLYAKANISRAYCSPMCRRQAKAIWRKQWSVAYRQGVRKQKQRKSAGPRPTCLECGKQFNRQQGSNSSNRYCSKACFFAARASGKQTWDKTNIVKGQWHRGGWYASAPSVRLMRMIARSHSAIEWAGNALCRLARKELAKQTCNQCGCPCKDGASRFCSYACNKAWRGPRPCELCGVVVANARAYGKCRCRNCRAIAKTAANRRQKRKYGRNHRQRARHHGVNYVAVEVKKIYERDGWRCQICRRMCKKSFAVRKKDGRPHPRSPTIDHIKAMANGGHHEPSNLQLACFECNTKKGVASCGQLRLAMT